MQTSANYRSTQSDLVNAAISAKGVFASSPVDTYPTGPSGQTGVSLVAMLQSTEPELSFTTNPVTYSPTPHALYVAVSTDGRILFLAAQSKDGRCWYVEANEGFAYAASKFTQPSCLTPPVSFSGWSASFPN